MAYRQATFSLLFFVGTVFVAMVAVPQLLEASGTSVFIDTNSKNVPVISQNFHHEINRWINKNIIPLHLKTSYQYLAMATYFDRSDVALPGFSKYCRALSEKERGNADYFMSYLNKRGGYTEFRDIEAPTTIKWSNGLDVMYDILETEKDIVEKLRRLHTRAAKNEDPHTTHIIEDRFIDRSIKLIKEVGDHIGNLQQMTGTNYGLAEYIFDMDL